MSEQREMKNDMKLPKYASLLSDAGFKAVLAEPRNKTVLMKILNLVLPQDRQIVGIESYCDREINGFTPLSKYSRIDIRVKDIFGREFIVEMQRKIHDCFFQRCVWYGSNAYGHSLGTGAEYEDLKPVFVIAFLEQNLPHKDESQWDSENCVSCYQMTEKRTGEFAPDTIMCIFVELGRFSKGRDELSNSFEKICYVFKNAEKWNAGEVPEEIIEDELANELVKVCEVENFSPDTKLDYLRTMFTEMDYKAEMKAYYKEGVSDTAAKMLAAGIPTETIVACTGLSVEKIKRLTTKKV